jgi:aurora kinase
MIIQFYYYYNLKLMSAVSKWSKNDFEFITPVQKGSYSIVYTGIHIHTKIKYILKKIKKDVIFNPIQTGYDYPVKYEDNEIDIHEKLNHPNIIKLYGSFIDNGTVWVVMEYAPYGDFFELRRIFSEKMTSIYIHQLLGALQYLHCLNIIHRDVKMENIFLGENNTLKLGDFGFAVKRKNIEDNFSTCLIGSTFYVSPEMVKNESYNYKIDLWCVGCITYEMLMSYPPFFCSESRILNEIVNKKVLYYPPWVSKECKDFIYQLLHKNPKDRMELSVALQHPFITKYNVNTSHEDISTLTDTLHENISTLNISSEEDISILNVNTSEEDISILNVHVSPKNISKF